MSCSDSWGLNHLWSKPRSRAGAAPLAVAIWSLIISRTEFSPQQRLLAVKRLIDGENAGAVARALGVSTSELLRWQRQVQKIADKEARKEALEATREARVEERIRRYLAAQKYSVTTRRGLTGPDIVATKEGRTLLVEVKGDRPGHVDHAGTIHVDVHTLLGQIVMAKAQRLADEYAVAVRPIHMRLLERALPVLRELGIKVLVVEDDDIHEG